MARDRGTGHGPEHGTTASTDEPGLASVHALPDSPPDADGLTTRQRMVLETIRSSVESRGYPPSMREIGEAVGLTSPSSVKHQLTTLERKGYLRRDPNRPRAIEVVQADDSRSVQQWLPSGAFGFGDEYSALRDGKPTPSYVPVVGRIAAGGPILAEQAVEDVFPLPRQLEKPELERVTNIVDVGAFVGELRMAVAGRVDVGAPAEQQAVDALHIAIHIVGDREIDRLDILSRLQQPLAVATVLRAAASF